MVSRHGAMAGNGQTGLVAACLVPLEDASHYMGERVRRLGAHTGGVRAMA